MGLVLRKNLTTPLTHTQLDGNFEFLQITEWVYSNYEKGKLVYIVDPILDTLITYMCVKTHNGLLYPNKTFTLEDVDGTIYWKPLTNGNVGNTVDNVILLDDKITLRISFIDETYVDVNLSDTTSKGLVGHQFLKITSEDYGLSGNTVSLEYTGSLAMTENFIVVDLNDIEITESYYAILPNSDETTAGTILRVFLKEFPSTDYNFFLQTTDIDGTNRILGKNLETYVEESGYYLPLKLMETVDLIWDGNDWLVINYIKEEYVSALTEPINL